MEISYQTFKVDQLARARLMQQRPACLWLTGLSGAGKSTIADQVAQDLHAMGYCTYVLDGDNVRNGLNRDLGFSQADRTENIRRIAEVAKLMTVAGLVVLVSAISPYRMDRDAARARFGGREFIEIHISTSLEVCIARDTKGLYRRARAGQIRQLTGWDEPYECPLHPELSIDTAQHSIRSAAACIVRRYLADSPDYKSKLHAPKRVDPVPAEARALREA